MARRIKIWFAGVSLYLKAVSGDRVTDNDFGSLFKISLYPISLGVVDVLNLGFDVLEDFEVGLLVEHGFPELSVLLSDVFLGGLDGVSVVLGLSGDHEPMDLLGESSVVGEDVLVPHGIILVGKFPEDGTVVLLVI